MIEDNHHSSLIRTFGSPEARYDPYWNIEVCETCGGDGSVPSGVEYMGQQEMLGCDACSGIGYINPRILEILEQLDSMI